MGGSRRKNIVLVVVAAAVFVLAGLLMFRESLFPPAPPESANADVQAAEALVEEMREAQKKQGQPVPDSPEHERGSGRRAKPAGS